MFQGETAITIDDKGRLAIPTAFREQVASTCGNRLVITYDAFESTGLYIYPYPAWEPVRDRVNALSKTKRAHRVLQLKLVGAAEIVELDGNGRISIPASHRKVAGIDRRAVLVGMGDKFQLMSEADHMALAQQALGDEDLGDELEGFNP